MWRMRVYGVRGLLLILGLWSVSAAWAEPVTLSAADWARPRSGTALVQQPALARAVQALEKSPRATVLIAHPRDEAGQLWAEELRAWLVALGISSAQIYLEPRPTLRDELVLDLRAHPWS